jgi:LysR family transcriptional regulator, hydrogen peroxide-inducible genes activator
MEMHQVRYFLAVARERNFTRAADQCNVTQPSLTRAIQKLEEEFGGPLFRRERALTHLTDLGRMMHPLLERSYDAAQQARALARQLERAQVAPLSLGIEADVHMPELPALFGHMGSRVVGLELALQLGEGADLLQSALAGDLDAFIAVAREEMPSRVDCWELRQERYGLLLPAGHPLAGLDRIEPEALDGHAAILLGSPVEDSLTGAGASPVHRAGSGAAAALLVAAGVGMALLPEGLSRPQGTVWRPLSGCSLERTVVLAAVAGRRRSAAADIFLKSVRARGWPV